jgi:hypothetical protein
MKPMPCQRIQGWQPAAHHGPDAHCMALTDAARESQDALLIEPSRSASSWPVGWVHPMDQGDRIALFHNRVRGRPMNMVPPPCESQSCCSS